MPKTEPFIKPEDYELTDELVALTRTAKVVKGGKNLGFRALVVVGNKDGIVGVGTGKANEVPESIRKGIEQARKNLKRIPRWGTTIPHEILGRHGAAKVLLRPASPGTGIIAGGPARAVLGACGIRDCFAKSLGSNNSVNVVKATMSALTGLLDAERIAKNRGKSVREMLWSPARLSVEDNADPGTGEDAPTSREEDEDYE